MITVIIPLNYGSWENKYNIETPLSKVASDFISDNNMNSIQKNHYVEFSFKNEPLEMNSHKLKYLIHEDSSTIHIAQEIKAIPGTEKLDEDEAIDIVGKPFSEPFQIFTFEASSKIIKILLFNSDKIKKKRLDKFGIDSAYCNGNNYLYISGGIDQTTNETLGLFWAIDLKKKIFEHPLEMSPKKNHSMIYSEKKVYIIGGEDTNTMFYDVVDKEIKKWESLNFKRFEPSLIKHNNFLFCFDTSKKYVNTIENAFNFEKIDLYSENAKWEVVQPEISPNLKNIVFCQKFFGVVEDYRENIIFVGGIYDKDNKENDAQEKKYTNLQYNTNSNTIEISGIEFKEISFSEKTFLPYDKKTYYILPNFNKRSPKIIFFHKDKNTIEVNSYHPKSHFKKQNKVKLSQIKPSLDGLNFDLPKNKDSSSDKRNFSTKFGNKNNNLTSNIYAKELNKVNNRYNINITDNDYNKVQNENNMNNKKKSDEIGNDNIESANISKIESNIDKQINASNKDNKDNINNSGDNINNNGDNIEYNEENIKNNKDNIKSNEDKINNNGDNKSNISKRDSKKEVNIKQDNTFKIGDSVNIQNANNIETIASSENQKIKSNNNVKKIIYFEKSELFAKYHSSLDNRLNNNVYNNDIIKKIKKRKNVPPPINIDTKTLKKKIKKINKSEYNEFRKNKNY